MVTPPSPVRSAADTVSFGTAITASDLDEAYALTLQAVLHKGHRVIPGPVDGPLQGKASRELIAFQVSIQDVRRRILINPSRAFNIIGAVARFTWMVAANNRLEDIAFYEPRVRRYSDNHLTVPGSDYGRRLFDPQPGLNQIQGVISTIERERGSRRAACVVWRPEDAVRDSNDIPCAFGTFYSARDGGLVSTTIMRSNNAFLLLPYNVFEFSLISEMIAASVGIDPLAYIHFAASMHVYDDQVPPAQEAIDAYYHLERQKGSPMPPMPRMPLPFEQATELARLEARLRHEFAVESPKVLFERGAVLHDYWRAFYNLLLAYALARASQRDEALSVARHIPDYFPAPMLPEGERNV